MAYAESNYEEAILEFFEELGYNRVLGYDINHDYYNPLFMDELEVSLQRINPQLPFVAIEEAVGKLQHFENGSLLQKNRVFMDCLQNGIPVSYYHAGEQKTSIVYLVDYDEVENNTFTVANQWTIIEQQEHRPDVLVFLNGIPVVVFELKVHQEKKRMHPMPTYS